MHKTAPHWHEVPSEFERHANYFRDSQPNMNQSFDAAYQHPSNGWKGDKQHNYRKHSDHEEVYRNIYDVDIKQGSNHKLTPKQVKVPENVKQEAKKIGINLNRQLMKDADELDKRHKSAVE